MKRNLGLLLASALLVFTLAACGGDDMNNGADSNDTPMTDNAVDNGNITDTPDNPVDDNTGDISDSNDNGTNTDENKSNEAITGTDDTNREDTVEKQSSRIGASYSQMLRNAHVHDTDGDLTDYENAVTPGASHLY